jgi:hypothetical protein
LLITFIFSIDYNAAKGKYLKYKYQNYTVAYQSEQKRKVGIIQNFFKIKNSIYCIISKLEKYKNIIELNEETQFVIDNLDRFFLICKRSENFDLIKIENIVSKCVLLQHNEDYFVSIFNENDEIID